MVTLSGQAWAQPADPPAPDAPPSDAADTTADATADSEAPAVEAAEPAPPEDTPASPASAPEEAEPRLDRPKPPPPPPPSDAVAGKDFRSRFVLESGRAPFLRADPDVATGQIRGEYQFRVTGLRDLPLKARPGGPDSLGQTVRVEHWLRLTPRFLFRDDLELIGQIDVPRGFIAGQETQEVGSAEEAYDERFPVHVAPRWLYLTWNSPIGVFRVGQQPSHWGLGLVANDGNHQSLFGDYRGGSIVERVLFATKPGGKDSKVIVAVAGDLVFKDRTADLTDEEYAWQGVLALTYSTDTGTPTHIYDAAMAYKESGTNLVVIGGEDYGMGSSRDWAAKGTRLLGVKAVVTKSFERIHRSNLIGMGVLPLNFKDEADYDKATAHHDATFSVTGLSNAIKPREEVTLTVKRADGTEESYPLVVRLDTPVEIDYYRAGGILPYVLAQILEG